MRTIAAGQFKATCLALMDEVQRRRQPIVITKRRKPVARLVAHEPARPDRFIGRLIGVLTIVGDISAPTDTWSNGADE